MIFVRLFAGFVVVVAVVVVYVCACMRACVRACVCVCVGGGGGVRSLDLSGSYSHGILLKLSLNAATLMQRAVMS